MSHHTPSLLDSIRRTIEERNLFSARSRLHFVSALRTATPNRSQGTGRNGTGSKNFFSPISTGNPLENRLIRMRNKVIEEIIKTEEDYVKQLKTIRDEFMEDTELKLTFTRRDFNAIFSNIPILLEVNERLLGELKGPSSYAFDSSFDEETFSPSKKKANKKAEPLGTIKSVASAFLNYTPYLKLYSTYASGYQQADSLLQRLVNGNQELRNLLKAKEERLNNTLQSYLITPIQRIPRYKLLLQQLIGFIGTAGKSDPDVQSLLESIKNLDLVALHMNEMIRQHENSCKLVELNLMMGRHYCGNLVEPGRTYIRSGTVLKLPTSLIRHSLTPNNQFYLVLLSDQLISCKIKSEIGSKGCLHPNLVLPLKKCSASIVDDLYAQVDCEEESLKFTLTDPDDLIEWVNVINESAKSLKKRSATLKKPSSNARPLKRDQIKTILKENNKRGVKRSAAAGPGLLESSPGPSPGKLRRFFNISGRLDELVDYLSPSNKTRSQKSSTPISPLRRLNLSDRFDQAEETPRRSMNFSRHPAPVSQPQQTNINTTPAGEEVDYMTNIKLLPVSKFPNTTCAIL